MPGLYCKFLVYRIDDTPVKWRPFVLNPEGDPAALAALRAYAENTQDLDLAANLWEWIGEIEAAAKGKP